MSVCTAQIYVPLFRAASDDACRAVPTVLSSGVADEPQPDAEMLRPTVFHQPSGSLQRSPAAAAAAVGRVHGRLGALASAAATSFIACWLSGRAMAASS
jgi:hypothetical protein